MGMFDTVKGFECECPFCKVLVTGFQSKDGPCTLGEVTVSQVQSFLSICHGCKAVLSFTRVLYPRRPTHRMVATSEDRMRSTDAPYWITEHRSEAVMYEVEKQ